tara:strand:+ start:5721 stop:7139 length:1419 start_codon:yes stop_codon:yes gene_type:complete
MNKTRRNFLKRSAALSLGILAQQFLTTSRSYADAVKKAFIWKNWSGNVSFTPKQVFYPETVEQVKQAILTSTKVRVTGAGHSFSALVPSVNLISPQKFKQIHIDSSRMEVTTGAGVTLSELNNALVAAGFALPTAGEIDHQTMAGLIATATKGTGVQFGSFSDAEQLLGLSIVDGRGEFHNIDFSDAKYKNVEPALRINLGAFGFVTAVKFKIVPSFTLKEVHSKASLTDAIQPENYTQNYRYSFYYYPHSHQTIKRTQNITTESYSDLALEKRNKKKALMEDTLGNLLITVLSHAPSLLPKASKIFFAQQPDSETAVGRWDKIMINNRKMRYLEMQYVLPVEKLLQAMTLIKAKTDELSKQGTYFVDIPVNVRFSRGDKSTLLSPAQDASKVYAQIDLNCHLKQKNSELFMKAVEKDLVALGAKPHWGKISYVAVGSLHEGIVEFENFRRQWDPENRFQNDFIKKNISDLV